MWLTILVSRTAPSLLDAHFSGSGFPPSDKPGIIDPGGALPDLRPRGFNLRTSGTTHAPPKGGIRRSSPGVKPSRSGELPTRILHHDFDGVHVLRRVGGMEKDLKM